MYARLRHPVFIPREVRFIVKLFGGEMNMMTREAWTDLITAVFSLGSLIVAIFEQGKSRGTLVLFFQIGSEIRP